MFVFPVPRALWHNKPEGATSTVIRRFDPGNAGLAFPEFGEMYANFGLVGVLLGSVLFALLVEYLWIRLAVSASPREIILSSVGLAILVQLCLRGAVAPMLAVFAGLIVATLLMCRRGSRSLSVADTPPAPPLLVESAIAAE
jgi:hypothetical protein